MALLCLLLGVRGVEASSAPDKEHQVKALFLFNFTQFVEWSVDAFPSKDAPIVVGILGPDPFHAYLDEVVSGEKVAGHSIIIKRFGRGDSLPDCHILFIGDIDAKDLEKAIAASKERKILTVGESDGFSRQGGMIRFTTLNGKIRLRINIDAVRAANLVLSSKLLRLAEIVTPGKG